MAKLILFNKPFQVLTQFRAKDEKRTLADYISIPQIYPAGRLDYDSEGLLLLTDSGQLQHKISHPNHKQWKGYWAQVEGELDSHAVQSLIRGVELKDGLTKPAKAKVIAEPSKLWARTPPIRKRANKPTSWLQLNIQEGKNRQVRRMTAAVGHPTLRLIRYQIGDWQLGDLQPGQYEQQQVHVPEKSKPTLHRQRRS